MARQASNSEACVEAPAARRWLARRHADAWVQRRPMHHRRRSGQCPPSRVPRSDKGGSTFHRAAPTVRRGAGAVPPALAPSGAPAAAIGRRCGRSIQRPAPPSAAAEPWTEHVEGWCCGVEGGQGALCRHTLAARQLQHRRQRSLMLRQHPRLPTAATLPAAPPWPLMRAILAPARFRRRNVPRSGARQQPSGPEGGPDAGGTSGAERTRTRGAARRCGGREARVARKCPPACTAAGRCSSGSAAPHPTPSPAPCDSIPASHPPQPPQRQTWHARRRAESAANAGACIRGAHSTAREWAARRCCPPSPQGPMLGDGAFSHSIWRAALGDHAWRPRTRPRCRTLRGAAVSPASRLNTTAHTGSAGEHHNVAEPG
jgi:hypothetical protein